MEVVVSEDSPLAGYLEGFGTLCLQKAMIDQAANNFFQGEGGEEPQGIPGREHDASSRSSSPTYAPRGRPTVRAKFRSKLPPPLRLAIPQNNAVAAIHNTCSVSSKKISSRWAFVDWTIIEGLKLKTWPCRQCQVPGALQIHHSSITASQCTLVPGSGRAWRISRFIGADTERTAPWVLHVGRSCLHSITCVSACMAYPLGERRWGLFCWERTHHGISCNYDRVRYCGVCVCTQTVASIFDNRRLWRSLILLVLRMILTRLQQAH
jgi:hypothetical protein